MVAFDLASEFVSVDVPAKKRIPIIMESLFISLSEGKRNYSKPLFIDSDLVIYSPAIQVLALIISRC